MLIQESFKVLVFSKTKHGAEKLAEALFDRGFKAGAIHGDLSQGQRERSLFAVPRESSARFGRDGRGGARTRHRRYHARHNYDLPMTYEDYIHRIGRTGRGANIGYAFTFVERSNRNQSVLRRDRLLPAGMHRR